MNSNSSIRPEQIIALPSVSNALYTLPQAKSLSGVAIHHASSAQRAAESEEKLKKVLAAQQHGQRGGAVSSTQSPLHPPSPGQAPLMMRTPARPKMRV